MKNILIVVVFSTFFLASMTSHAVSKQALVASALDEYGKVAGAWFMNKRCNYIQGQESKTFDNDVTLITNALGNDLGGPKVLYMVQAGAKKVTEKPKYSDCKGKSEEIFNYGYNHAKNWSENIRNMQSQ